MRWPMIVSEVGLTARGSSSSSIPAPAFVTHATSGPKPSMCSASLTSSDRGMRRGNAQFSWPLSLIMSSKARWIASHIARPNDHHAAHAGPVRHLRLADDVGVPAVKVVGHLGDFFDEVLLLFSFLFHV